MLTEPNACHPGKNLYKIRTNMRERVRCCFSEWLSHKRRIVIAPHTHSLSLSTHILQIYRESTAKKDLSGKNKNEYKLFIIRIRG